jgi:hypothetical protein
MSSAAQASIQLTVVSLVVDVHAAAGERVLA